VKRKDLLATSLGALVASRATAASARAPTPGFHPDSRDSVTLVLPGGGARGAYEAGAIEGLRQRDGIKDGTALPGLSAVVGTSIGAINAWFVATAQYSLLARIWQAISGEDIFRIKKQYAATLRPSSGVLTRIYEAALISQGLTSNVTGLLDGAPVREWLTRNIDPSVPLVMPYAFALTNLNEQRSEVFYRGQVAATAQTRMIAAQRLQSIFGKSIAAREIEDAHFVAALAGSSAIPILLDPVTIAFAHGSQTYIDGGVADSAPLDLARAFSRRIQLILVDPARFVPKNFANAAAIGTAAFSIAQNRVLESSLRSAYLETRGKKLFATRAATAEERAFIDETFDVDIFLMRPERELPVQVAAFDDAKGIAATYELGRQAGLAGFAPYDPSDAFA
jgi:predicted acylesterase/phospholipase RssA